MIQEEKLKKVCSDFSSLNGDQQDYILGILQALVFANTSHSINQTADAKNTDILSADIISDDLKMPDNS